MGGRKVFTSCYTDHSGSSVIQPSKKQPPGNKLRLTFTSVKMVVQGYEKPIEQTNRKVNEKQMTGEFNDIADQLGVHLSRSKGANW